MFYALLVIVLISNVFCSNDYRPQKYVRGDLYQRHLDKKGNETDQDFEYKKILQSYGWDGQIKDLVLNAARRTIICVSQGGTKDINNDNKSNNNSGTDGVKNGHN